MKQIDELTMNSIGFAILCNFQQYCGVEQAMDLGLFEVKETAITHSDGHVTINRTTKVTGRGQQYFVNRLLGKQEIA